MHSEVLGKQRPPCVTVAGVSQFIALAILQLQGPQVADLIKLLGTASFVSTSVTACYSTTLPVRPHTTGASACHDIAIDSLSVHYCLAVGNGQT